MQGRKLLLLRPLVVDEAGSLRPAANTVVAVDSLGAGEGETVLFCLGSSARQAAGMATVPVDAVVTGIVDNVDVNNRTIYPEAKAAK